MGLCRACLNVRLGTFAWAFWSHKVLRWLTPHLALIIAGISYPLLVTAYANGERLVDVLPACIAAGLLTTIISAGLLGRYMNKKGSKGAATHLCSVCNHFVTMHAALLVGFVRFCSGHMSGTWKRTPRSPQPGTVKSSVTSMKTGSGGR